MVGGRNLAGPNDPAARFTLAIDGEMIQQWDAAPGFFLHVFDIPAGRLAGDGPFAALTIQSTAVSGSAVIPTAIEQFDLQNPETTMWGFDTGFQESRVQRRDGCLALDQRACNVAHRWAIAGSAGDRDARITASLLRRPRQRARARRGRVKLP